MVFVVAYKVIAYGVDSYGVDAVDADDCLGINALHRHTKAFVACEGDCFVPCNDVFRESAQFYR